MNTQGTKALMQEIESLMQNRDFINPASKFEIHANRESGVIIRWSKGSDSIYQDEIEFFGHENPSVAASEAMEWIKAQPTKQQRAESYALEMTAKAIEASRDAGFEPDYMAELESMMKRLSENVIEGPKGGDA